MNEILSGIKVLKLYAWEMPFMKRILEKRQKELDIIKKYCILNSFNNFTYACSPILITMGAFTTYATINDGTNVLTPTKVTFMCLSTEFQLSTQGKSLTFSSFETTNFRLVQKRLG